MLIKAQRQTDFTPKNEADLLQKIDCSLPIEILERYRLLQEKRVNSKLIGYCRTKRILKCRTLEILR